MSEVVIAFSTLAAIMVLSFIGEIIAKKIFVPSAILLVFLGIVCGPLLHLFEYEALVAAVPFIAPLTIAFVCFEAGEEMNVYRMLRSSGRAAVLSVLGFVFSVIPVGVLLRFVLGLDWGFAFMLASAWSGMNLIIVNTVSDLLKLKKESRTTLTLLTMIDDPLVMISTLAILNYILLGGVSFQETASALMSNISISICIGALIGLAWLNLLYIARKTKFIYTFTLAAILFFYSLVEMLGGTGGIAIFVFGLIIGNYRSVITTLKLRLEKKQLSGIVRRIDGFHSEITFMLRSFFFTFLGLIYTFAGVTELLIGLAISILLHITRYLAFKIGTIRSPLKSDLPEIGLIVGQGVAAAAMSTLPLAYDFPNAAFYTNIALNVLLFTNILSIALPLFKTKIVKKRGFSK